MQSEWLRSNRSIDLLGQFKQWFSINEQLIKILKWGRKANIIRKLEIILVKINTTRVVQLWRPRHRWKIGLRMQRNEPLCKSGMD